MSIRLRLSLLYSAILALTLIAAGIILYTTQSQYTLDWLKRDLLISSETLSQSILQNSLGPKPQGDASEAAPTPPAGLTLSGEQAFLSQSQQEIVRVLDPDGALIASPAGSGQISLPLEAAGLQAVRAQQDWWSTQTVSGQRLLIYTRPVVYQGRVIAILQVARALSERDQSLQSLGRTLLAVTLAAILAAFGAGWFLAREALRPVWRITQTAQAIGRERDFARRVAHKGSNDEVGQLATTFNAMLAQLEEAYQQAARALERQRSFVADVSHELRTPLTTLRGNLGLLGRRPALPAEDQADILNDMVEESDRLIRLVNDLLTLARADAGRALAQEPVPLLPLLEECLRQARQLAPGRVLELEAPAGLAVCADRDALKQVLVILLDNALKYTPGPVRLSARLEGARAALCVQDEGPGIPPEQLERIFERFYRAPQDQSVPGLGLGLPIARSLVEGMGGSLAIQSSLELGSTLTLHLPAAPLP